MAGVSVASAQAFNYMTPGGGVRGFAIARTAGRYFERVTTHEATFRLLAQLRSWFYAHLEPLNPARLRHFRSADLLNRLITDINSLDNLYLRVISPSLIALVTGLLVSLFLGWIAPSLGVMLFVALLVSGLLIPMLGHKLGAATGREMVGHTSALRQRTLSYVQGMMELHVYSALELQQQELNQAQQALLQAQLRMSLVSGMVAALMTLAAGLTTLLALVIGINLVTEGVLSPAWLALVVFCVLASFESVASLPLAYQYLGKTRAAAESLQEVTQQRSDIHFPDTAVVISNPGEIQLDQVGFAYDDTPVLRDVSLQVSPGEKVALVGHTGSGKSSIINLLSRFWLYQQGRILLGGVEVESYPEQQLREQMAVLSQPVQLFAGSVRSNLQLADPQASDEQMLALLDQLGLTEMLGNDGLNREVGESGNRLSGGQRKRLGIARAMLKDAPILILDEPTEGLDNATAVQVMQSVFGYRPGQTLLIITHHLQGLDRYDQVIRLDQGRRLD
ncbi:thiol reductant ABC exporter subunit CydC [Nitrincola sp. A-D6]|uniref:thiol reductant ABC exporter subunit CydC n=1 Tax=Nitrincola sp. A-D6 TaxID=1545442 RepID=UPI001F35785A|nr:thiol reductant ABC exporter subunit CydC [Nitrincola sp. A-D6]